MRAGAESIFAPMVALVLLTFAVMLFMAFKRFTAVASGRAHGRDFRLGEAPTVPQDVSVANRNFMNLLEAPVLFYALCLSLYVTQHVTQFTLGMAWVYVALRFAHTGFHLFYNRILYRFTPYALSNVVLAVLWLWFAAALFG